MTGFNLMHTCTYRITNSTRNLVCKTINDVESYLNFLDMFLYAVCLLIILLLCIKIFRKLREYLIGE